MIKKILILSLSSILCLMFMDYKIYESNKIYIQIHGNVKKPGIYTLKEGNRVYHAINAAGGLSENYQLDLRKLNISRLLKDGENLFVGDQITQSKENLSHADDNNLIQNNLININVADISELEKLPGIGKNTAQKIIDNRPFESIDDIKKVSGIGDRKFEKIKDFIVI